MGIRKTTIRNNKREIINSIVSFLEKIEFASKTEIEEHLKSDRSLNTSVRNSAGVVADYLVKSPNFIKRVSCLNHPKSLWSNNNS